MEDTGWSIKTEFLSTSNFFPSASADTGLVLEDISLYLSRFTMKTVCLGRIVLNRNYNASFGRLKIIKRQK